MWEIVFDLQRFENINNVASNTLVSGTTGDDIITNSGEYVTIDGGAGDDSIGNTGSNVSINGGDGNDVITDENGSVSVDINAVIYSEHSYKLFDDGMTWDEAKAYCENLGGHLVTITDSEEQTFIESLLVNGTKNSYWLGGFRNENNAWQ